MSRRFFEQVFAQDQVARLGRLVDQRAAFLVVENHLDVVGQRRITPKLIEIFEREVVQPALSQLFDERQRRPRILAGPRWSDIASQPQEQSGQNNPV